MPKDETATFFNQEAQNNTNGFKSPDNASKWLGVAEKGITLFENLIKMREAKANGGQNTNISTMVENKAQKMVEQMPVKEAKVFVKKNEATNYLVESLKSLDQNKTIGEYVEGEIKQMQESGILNSVVEKFLTEFTEVIQ